MFLRVILVEDEARQFHDLEVDDDVPKDHRVFSQEFFLGQDSVAFLAESIQEFFVEGNRWEQLQSEAFSSVDEV